MAPKTKKPKKEKQIIQTIHDFVAGDYNVATGLSGTYSQAVTTRKEFIKKFSKIKSFYLVEALLLTIADDALGADITTGEVVEISSDIPKINKELEKLQKKIDFDQIVRDIVVDLLSNGEHTLSIKSDKDGVTHIEDNVSQQDIVAFYKQGYPIKFLKMGANTLSVVDATQYAHFSLDNYKLRVSISSEFKRNTVKTLQRNNEVPKYARVGRPVFFGVLSKLKELELLEKLLPAQKINAITSGNILSVNVPESTEPKEALAIARTYEDYLNKKSALDRGTGELTVANILTNAGRTRVLPVFGDGKGTVTPTDAKENRQSDDLLSSIKDTREVICSSIGFPPQMLFGSDGQTKTDLLKQYGRYLRRLKSIQGAIAHGLKQIIHIHFGAKNEVLGINDINITFRNKLVNIEELEKEEFKQAMFESIKSTTDFITELTTGEVLDVNFIDKKKYAEWVKNKFIGLDPSMADVFNVPDNKEVAKEPVATQDQGTTDNQVDQNQVDNQNTDTGNDTAQGA